MILSAKEYGFFKNINHWSNSIQTAKDVETLDKKVFRAIVKFFDGQNPASIPDSAGRTAHLNKIAATLPAKSKKLQVAIQDYLKSKDSRKPIEKTSFLWSLPYAGVAVGMLTGIGSRLADATSSLSTKNKEACRKAFTNAPILRSINGFKQWEIKTFALATPLIPLAVKIGMDAKRDQSQQGIISRISAAVKKNFTLEQTVYLATLLGLSLTGSAYCSASGACSKDFDPSGHMMLKTALAGLISKVIVKETGAWAYALSAIYSATDAVLVHNTNRFCHTVAESAAGLAWGLGIVTAAAQISKRFAKQ
ncbi:MAG: hypothetical protein JSS32_05940 [Verrucomicrobia bacterium]|nr:hypothetical protein [Verrucomicrobiota bacterium]